MYVYFDVQGTVLACGHPPSDQRRSPETAGAGRHGRARRSARRNGLSHQGVVDFINNQVTPTTRSIRARRISKSQTGRRPPPVIAANVGPRPPSSRQTGTLAAGFRPGHLVRPRAALCLRGGCRCAVQERLVSVGELQDDGLRVIKPVRRHPDGTILAGLEPDEWVVVGRCTSDSAGNDGEDRKACHADDAQCRCGAFRL